MTNILTLGELEQELRSVFSDAECDLELAAMWMRYAYGMGYLGGLADPNPDIEHAMIQERKDRMRLP